ncbi:MAG: hypothetical protein JSU06_08535 [Actinobacteria bacterium]|nr:hypothetical protein [Actinomycetota bacterium]
MITIPEPPIPSAGIGLRLLRPELSRAALETLSAGPRRLGDLCAGLMLESDTTLREHLDQLEAFGAVARGPEDGNGAGEFRLTAAGEDLLGVGALAASWLTVHPGRPLRPESDGAWRAFAALGDGWELSLVQHLLQRPRTRAELIATIPGLGRQKAKRMLRRLEGAGLVRAVDDGGRVPRYVLTVWARRAIAWLAAIAYWERRHLGSTAEPVGASDGAIGLLACLPLARAPVGVEGVCAFTVEGGSDPPAPRACAVWARVAEGRVTSSHGGAPPVAPDGWIRGDVDAWLRGVIDARPRALHLGGDRVLGEATLRGLHEALYRPVPPSG